jgi:hypothetical protein
MMAFGHGAVGWNCRGDVRDNVFYFYYHPSVPAGQTVYGIVFKGDLIDFVGNRICVDVNCACPAFFLSGGNRNSLVNNTVVSYAPSMCVLHLSSHQLCSTATTWLAGHEYAAGSWVVPTAVNGYAYYNAAGGTSADPTEPTWPIIFGGKVVDGTVTWQCFTSRAAYNVITDNIFAALTDGNPALGLDGDTTYSNFNRFDQNIYYTTASTNPVLFYGTGKSTLLALTDAWKALYGGDETPTSLYYYNDTNSIWDVNPRFVSTTIPTAPFSGPADKFLSIPYSSPARGAGSTSNMDIGGYQRKERSWSGEPNW